ncbi:quinolinate synthase, chloroplastic-like isoform X1 [Ananas comosus]|uniref:Quinolinate synthase, chloroplastic n=1 Tax=Ananas comosus TaxID=4615 RepID=A0A6P5GGX4_ANACO|nr:quinolinate synthase, chloroplastic-like isoform X1 [Ananas comosus]
MDSSALAARVRALRLPIPNPNPSLSPTTVPVLSPGSRPWGRRLSCRLAARCSGPVNPNPNPNPKPSLSCSAVAAQEAAPAAAAAADIVRVRLRRLVEEFHSLPEPLDRVKRLLEYAAVLPPFPEAERAPANRVMGCTAQVWVSAAAAAAGADGLGRMRFAADSDSEITKGFCACLLSVLDGAPAEEVLELRPEDFGDLNVVGLPGRAHSRVNTWHNVLISLQKRTKALIAKGEGRPPVEPFPSLVIGADGIRAKGSYAEAQAKFLSPNAMKVKELVSVLREKKIGVVAHFYMDPEVQGILTAAKRQWPHIHISDSLVMADAAVKMAEAGCQYITVLGVDFMSENVRAILDQAGFEKVGVYRMSNEQIGCSLADAAASPRYMQFLETASRSPPSLHVIYINTSLETKAYGHELVPTITCTSSNVVQTILQAFAQIPDLNVWYGPDSYMGANIAELFQQMSCMSDEEIAEVHPKHDRNSIKSLLPRLHYFQEGNCIVHDMFGHEIVERIRELYCDAFLTAHFEVPGEMFSLAMEAKKRGMGVVGSTQNILDFIKNRLKEALERSVDDRLQFVLGTESGMITSIAAAVRDLLGSGASSSSGRAKIEVEIVFPVSSDSVTKASPNGSHGSISTVASDLTKLAIVPGVATGEGCSIHGGCASCPYMKMNSLQSLLAVCHQLPDKNNALSAYQASRFSATTPLGRSVAEIGCEPILHMRKFQATSKLPEKLVDEVLSRTGETVS